MQVRIEQIERNKIEEISQEKVRFYMNMSHELRTPLSLILAPLEELLGQSNLKGTPVQQKLDIFVNEEGEEELFPLEHPQKQEMVCEKKKYGFLKKFGKKIKSGYWGDWEKQAVKVFERTPAHSDWVRSDTGRPAQEENGQPVHTGRTGRNP